MTCLLKNNCANQYLCCHFCDNKKCSERCKATHKNCSWHENGDPTKEGAEPPKFEFQKERERKRCNDDKRKETLFNPKKIALFTYRTDRTKEPISLPDAVRYMGVMRLRRLLTRQRDC